MTPKTRKIIMDTIMGIIGALIVVGMLIAILLRCLEPEVWYANTHTKDCELLYGEDKCTCYERLVKQAKEEEAKYEKEHGK